MLMSIFHEFHNSSTISLLACSLSRAYVLVHLLPSMHIAHPPLIPVRCLSIMHCLHKLLRAGYVHQCNPRTLIGAAPAAAAPAAAVSCGRACAAITSACCPVACAAGATARAF